MSLFRLSGQRLGGAAELKHATPDPQAAVVNLVRYPVLPGIAAPGPSKNPDGRSPPRCRMGAEFSRPSAECADIPAAPS